VIGSADEAARVPDVCRRKGSLTTVLRRQTRTRQLEHAAQVQRDAQRTADAVRAGTKDAGPAAEEIQDDATGVADETLDAAQHENLPDAAREQLEQARAELGAAARD
jgi:hypothetical protein